MSEKKLIIDGWDASGSILAMPEPVRSRSLARLGMTEAEFVAHMKGRDAQCEERSRMEESGEIPIPKVRNYSDGGVEFKVAED